MNKESLNLINSFLFSIVVSFFPLTFVFLLPIFVVLFIEKDKLNKIFRKLIYLNFFIFILVLFVFFQNKDEAIEIFFRTNLILLFNIALFYKSKGYDIVRGLDSLGFPEKFVSVFYFTISLIEHLMFSFKEIKNSLKSRGFRSSTSLFTYQTYGNIFALIFIKAIKKSEDMRCSMTTRGFENKIYFLKSDKIATFEIVLFSLIVIIYLKVFYELFS
ncbi:MAG: energy-coupling factor transporter transmembrane component T family protein [Arcobacter sp.]|uniref:energy-coupling factor transporter transmembrane component T family protein n=1 Tax=Arcobacter sp. TaxID=1872629 RepID=UPI003B00A7E7